MQTSNAYPELTEIKIDGAQINEPKINGAARSVQLGRGNELAECLAPYQHRRLIANRDAGRHIEAEIAEGLDLADLYRLVLDLQEGCLVGGE